MKPNHFQDMENSPIIPAKIPCWYSIDLHLYLIQKSWPATGTETLNVNMDTPVDSLEIPLNWWTFDHSFNCYDDSMTHLLLYGHVQYKVRRFNNEILTLFNHTE